MASWRFSQDRFAAGDPARIAARLQASRMVSRSSSSIEASLMNIGDPPPCLVAQNSFLDGLRNSTVRTGRKRRRPRSHRQRPSKAPIRRLICGFIEWGLTAMTRIRHASCRHCHFDGRARAVQQVRKTAKSSVRFRRRPRRSSCPSRPSSNASRRRWSTSMPSMSSRTTILS